MNFLEEILEFLENIDEYEVLKRIDYKEVVEKL